MRISYWSSDVFSSDLFGIPKWPFRDVCTVIAAACNCVCRPMVVVVVFHVVQIVRVKRSIKNVQNQLQHCTDPQERKLLQQTLNKMLVQEDQLQSRRSKERRVGQECASK